jgi:hypothetical protein
MMTALLDATLDLPSLAFIAVSVFAFVWMVRLSFTIHRKVHDHAKQVHERVDELEDITRSIRRDAHALSVELNDKADVTYLERRLDGLLDLMKEQTK